MTPLASLIDRLVACSVSARINTHTHTHTERLTDRQTDKPTTLILAAHACLGLIRVKCWHRYNSGTSKKGAQWGK